MKILFFCSSLESGRDGVGDYTRRLAAECIRMGNECEIISLNDCFVLPPSSVEWQVDGVTKVHCLRLSSSRSWGERIKLAKAWISRFSPDICSLQFVLYSFHPKGLPFSFCSVIKDLIGHIPCNIMFHETWLGGSHLAPLKHEIIGWMQRLVIRRLITLLRPFLILTSNQYYQNRLCLEGILADVLPMFSNISVVNDASILEHLRKEFISDFSLNLTTGYRVLIHFGAMFLDLDYIAVINKEMNRAACEAKSLVFITVGRNHAVVPVFDKLRSHCPGLQMCDLGERDPAQISALLQMSDVSVCSTPKYLKGKSGSYAAKRLHGLPVWLLQENGDWQLDEVVLDSVTSLAAVANNFLNAIRSATLSKV